MQAAYDAADRKALADVMTPAMFTEVSSELANRGAHLPTEVRDLVAQVLEVTTEGNQHWMSVRFTGLLREDGTVLEQALATQQQAHAPEQGIAQRRQRGRGHRQGSLAGNPVGGR